MRKPLTKSQCIVLVLLWASLCFIVITTTPHVDGPLVVSIIISGALVFIPVYKALRKDN